MGKVKTGKENEKQKPHLPSFPFHFPFCRVRHHTNSIITTISKKHDLAENDPGGQEYVDLLPSQIHPSLAFTSAALALGGLRRSHLCPPERAVDRTNQALVPAKMAIK